MDLRDLALVIDGGVKEYEARYVLPPSGHYGELHTALVGMRETALRLMSASDDRKRDLVTELIEEVFSDGDGS
jgi:hypothetical protein